MNKIPTAEEFWIEKTGRKITQEEYSAMIDFASRHVEKARSAIIDSIRISSWKSYGESGYGGNSGYRIDTEKCWSVYNVKRNIK